MIIRNDRQATLTGDFFKGHSYEVAVVAVGLDGTKQAMEIAPKNSIMIKGKEDAPTPASALTATGFFGAIVLTWTNPLDYDFSHMEVWRSWTGNIAYAVKVAEVKGITYTDPLGTAGATRWYWVRAVNTSGIVSDYYPDDTVGVSATTLGVTVTDIDDFSVTATKMFNKTIVLVNDVWTNNSPSAGKIAWNAHKIVHNGVAWSIDAGNTALAYIYWAITDTTYSTSATHPTLGTGFMIAINTAGIHTLVWNSSANMVIGTAFIANLAVTDAKIANATITNAKIANLDATKITTGTLVIARTEAKCTDPNADATGANTAKDIAYLPATPAGAGLYCDATHLGYHSGATWQSYIGSDGKFYFTGDANNYVSWNGTTLTVRGALTADNIITGTLTAIKVRTDTGGAGHYKRIELNVSDNTLRMYDALNNNIITIDDDILGVPGIGLEKSTGAIVYVKSDANNYGWLYSAGGGNLTLRATGALHTLISAQYAVNGYGYFIDCYDKDSVRAFAAYSNGTVIAGSKFAVGVQAGVNWGPGAPASITVVGGIITAIS